MAHDTEFAKQMNIAVFFVSGVFLAIAGVPMALRRVRPNRIYGFRTPKTLSNERIWYAANQTSGRWLVVCGIATAAASLAFKRLDFGSYTAVVLGVMFAGLFLSVGLAWFKDIRGK